MNTLCHQSDCYVERTKDIAGECAILQDEEGNHLFRFPASWTDEQIHHALAFANKAFSQGVELGKSKKQYEIRAVLGIAHP